MLSFRPRGNINGTASPINAVRHIYMFDAPTDTSGGAGQLPICGMTLEPVKATADVGENRELVDMTRRFWIGWLSRCRSSSWKWEPYSALGLDDLVPPRISTWIQFALSTP